MGMGSRESPLECGLKFWSTTSCAAG